MPNLNSSRFKGSVLFTIVVIIGITLIILDGFVSVPAGNVAVIFDQGRGVLPNALPEGLHLKIPFWQKAIVMSIRTQEYTMSVVQSEGALFGDDSIEARSKDGQIVRIDATVLFHIEKNKASIVYQKIGRERDYVRVVIRPLAREAIRNSIAKYNSLDLVSEVRDEVVSIMTQRLKDSYAPHNITLDSVALRNVSFSPEFAKAIEEKQIEFQRIKTAEYQKQQAEQLKQKKIIEAEADAEAIRLKAETLRNNPSVIGFEFVQKIAPNIKWGILPSQSIPLLDLKELSQ